MAVLDQLALRSEFFPTAHQVVATLEGDPAAIAEHCLEGFDFYPLDAPEMALPGPDFVRQAEQLGDPAYKAVGVREEKRLEAVGPWLTYLYLRALYDPTFSIDVNVKGTLKTAPFLPGHLWGFTADGPRPADIMVIGKNPGVEEMAEQRNFAGLSSRPLYHALDVLQVPESEREKWYVTSVIKHPHLDPASATLAKSWQANCRPILQQELRLVRPKFILCLGKEASTAVTGNTHAVSAMAGRIVDVKIPLHRYGEEPEYHIAKAMTIYNPAYIAREPKHFDQFRIGLAHFLALAKGDRVHKKEKLDYRYIRDEDHLADVVDEVIESGHRMLAVDAEWHGEHPDEDHAYLRTLQFSHKPKFGAVVVLREQGGQPCFYNRRGRVDFGAARRQLSRLLIPHTDGSWDPMVGGHFFRSDLPWLYHFGIDLRKYYAPPKKSESCPKPWEETKHWGGWDTGLMYHSLYEDGDLDLTTLTLRFTEMDRYDILLDEWKTKYCKEHYNGKASDLQGYGECPSDILHPYAAGDVDATIRLAWTANGVNGEPGMMDHDDYGNSSREAYWIHHSASLAYLEMEMVGIGFDKARAEGLMEDFIEARDRLAGDLRQQLRWPDFNYRSTTQCKEFLFGQQLNGTKDKATGLPKRLRQLTV
jgi:uracil-DNA glycosylase family 4